MTIMAVPRYDRLDKIESAASLYLSSDRPASDEVSKDLSVSNFLTLRMFIIFSKLIQHREVILFIQI